MSLMPSFEQVPPPGHPPIEALDPDAGCGTVLAPLAESRLDRIEAAGSNRQMAATAMMAVAESSAASQKVTPR